MRRSLSLRQRLFLLILTPLVAMAILLGYWRFSVAQHTAEELFDRSLLATALAVSRDVAISEGDALLPLTRSLMQDVAGGEVFYHVTGPDGIYVTGYAYPPVHPKHLVASSQPAYFEAIYRDEPVRVMRMTEQSTIDGLTGDATVTVWQRLSDRNGFARELALRAVGLMGVLLITLALVVWFGVELGLRPLTDLQGAIAARSPDDLSTIKRRIPAEARGIVATLNRLFGQVESSLNAHQAFISDAAHQLRNPAAAVLSMAETVRDATSDSERDKRIGEMIGAARASSRVTEQLLSLDRLRQGQWAATLVACDLEQLTEQVCADLASGILSQGVDFEFVAAGGPLPVLADRLFVAEAIKNLIDNALKHGGPELHWVCVQTGREADQACVTVCDDGVGLSPADQDKAFSRFGQVQPSGGSGLGLAIAQSVAEGHRGDLHINTVAKGACITLALPLA